jgi:hypothetical protein
MCVLCEVSKVNDDACGYPQGAFGDAFTWCLRVQIITFSDGDASARQMRGRRRVVSAIVGGDFPAGHKRCRSDVD